MAFDPLFRWLQNTIIPRNPAAPDVLQPSPCAYAEDFGSGCFVLSFVAAGLNLNHRTCCWVQFGSENCHELMGWVSTNFEEFREMKTVKYAKYVGTMIGPEGHIQRWTAPRKKHLENQKINESTKSLVERLCDFKIFALSVLG